MIHFIFGYLFGFWLAKVKALESVQRLLRNKTVK